ncbi:hypothetical protein SKAU_G00022260 [Synaphobranchus kaupii]|uniref:Uncharacterized protein n=1 Tax=Synaphobranchus kaupii TaxID=118154 RepID=A0A9Q1JD91_SYNKA|nr:hypothetical protein SKAU_G00022260 [Synaphobranchus kaupii]
MCTCFQFLYVASLVTTISDVFPNTLRKPGRHEVLVLIIVLICFLFGLLLVTEGGFNVFNMIRMHGISGAGLMFIACFETITIGWIYGADRFYDNIEDMIGYQPFPVIKYCWLFVTPLFCVVLIIYSLAMPWIYPGLWITKTAALLMLAPILCIPVFVLVPISKDQLDFTTPASDLKQARPYKPRLSLCKRVILGGRKPDSKQADEEKPAAESTSGV